MKFFSDYSVRICRVKQWRVVHSPGHSDTLSGSGRIFRVSDFSEFEKLSHSDILKTHVGFESDPLGSGWVWI